METKINKLEKELENAGGSAPMTPQELSVLSPTATATSSLLKTGMTLTQIYSQYVEVSDSLQQEQDENTRLKHYLDQILKEIEEKGLIIKRQRQEYEQALNSVDQLSKRLDTALVEHEELQVEADESRKHCEHLKRENERMKTLNADLSQQVKRIARHYKTQYDELKKSTGDQSKQAEAAEGETTTAAAAATTTTAAAPATESPPMETAGADVGLNDNKVKELEEKVQSLEAEIKKAKEANEQKEATIKEKDDKNKRVLMQVREKLQQLTGQRDKLTTEIEETKKKEKAATTEKEAATQRASELEMRLQVLKSQYDGKLARLEKELKELKEAKEEKEKMVEELQQKREELQQSMKAELDQLMQKNQQLQKQIQQQQLKIAAITAAAAAATSAGARPAPGGESSGPDMGAPQDGMPQSVVASTPVTSSAPPTATIKPTTTPSTSSGIKPTATPKASIRPMAVAPATPTPTPTATVLPTVTPTSTPQEPAARVALAPPTSVPATVSVRPITSSVAQSSQAVESVHAAAEFVVSSVQDTGEASVSSSAEPERPLTMTTAVVSGKRQREDSDVIDRPSSGEEELRAHREPRGKKIKVTLVESEPGPSDVDFSDELTFEGALGEQPAQFMFQPQEQEEHVQLQQQLLPQEQLQGLLAATDARGRMVAQQPWVSQGSPEDVLIESDDDDDEEDINREELDQEGEEFEEEGEEGEIEEEGMGEEEEDYGQYEDEEEPEQEDEEGEREEDVGDDIVEVIDDEPEAGEQGEEEEEEVQEEETGMEEAIEEDIDRVQSLEAEIKKAKEANEQKEGHPAPGTFDETDDCQPPSTPELIEAIDDILCS